jgi:hypothetical protein
MKKIPPFRLKPEPLDEEARQALEAGFKWAKDVGLQHQLGGEPDFVQGEESPTCRECKGPMSFYAQLDSINDEYMIADCGMIYVFYCFECATAEVIVQSA